MSFSHVKQYYNFYKSFFLIIIIVLYGRQIYSGLLVDNKLKNIILGNGITNNESPGKFQDFHYLGLDLAYSRPSGVNHLRLPSLSIIIYWSATISLYFNVITLLVDSTTISS